MAKKRRKRMNLGDAPLAHARKLRKAIQHYRTAANSALYWAEKGKCRQAQEDFEDAHRWRGMVQVHMDSLGGKRNLARDTINLAPLARQMIVVRKALENRCGREKAVR